VQTILFSFSARSFSSETSSVSIARVNEANVEDVLDFQPEHYVRTFRQFLRQGDVGYYAYVDGRCCHRSWVQRGPRWVDINPFVQMKLEKNEACIHYCETAPWARGKSIYPSVLSRIAEDHRGYGDLFICVDSQNTASIRGVEKAGFRERESRSPEGSQNLPLSRLRIVIITQGITPVLSSILASRHEIVGIVQAAPRKGVTRGKNVGRLLLRYAYAVGRRLAKGTSGSLRALAGKKKIPYYYMGNGCDDALETWIRELAPDVIAVYSMSELLKKNIWSLPPLGTINLHPAALPSYRGPNPYFFMYMDMVPEGGVTIHRIDDGEDTGDILAQDFFPIPLGMSPSALHRVVQERGGDLMVEVLNRLAREDVAGAPQPPMSPTPRAKSMTPTEMWQHIDRDTWPVERIFHCLRYLEPQLHRVEGFELPWWYRWEVAGFSESSEGKGKQPHGRALSGKTGSILLRKRLFFLKSK